MDLHGVRFSDFLPYASMIHTVNGQYIIVMFTAVCNITVVRFSITQTEQGLIILSL
jgi:hypothetical protein